ncbi:MAG: radical SAM protein [candidate division KSB1 bacterium]|nr:radical SAM protein [candidate division KSB1 bacterium]
MINLLKHFHLHSSERVTRLHVVALMPHSACNCRCVMCDIWKANASRQELTRDDLLPHIASFRKFEVKAVILSGGEALMHSNLWRLCELLKELPVKISLLSTGLLLAFHAGEIIRWCDDVILSLDGTREVHDAIRNVPNAYDRLARGVAALKRLNPKFRVSARCVIQRRNYFALPNIIEAAHEIGLDQISFLAVDVATTAFNRPTPWGKERIAEVALSMNEIAEFSNILEETIRRCADDFASGFIAETPDKMRRLPQYFAALNGMGDFPENHCNAPWVSTVIEADGTVRPCFFHRPLGNIRERPLEAILNSDDAIAFRNQLDIKRDPICRKCVCTLCL